jgi:hypothetical protein
VLAGQVQVSHPALECPSRLCVITSSASGGSADAGTGLGMSANGTATCTATCNSDGDCTPETTKYCPAGFVCAVATAVDSSFCCKKLCVCRSGLQPNFNVNADGGVVTPTECDPTIQANLATCVNLKQ